MDEQSIRERAYHLWMDAGRPNGRDQEFWEHASTEAAQPAALPAQSKVPKPEPLPARAGKPFEAKAVPVPVPVPAAAAKPRKKAKAAKGR